MKSNKYLSKEFNPDLLEEKLRKKIGNEIAVTIKTVEKIPRGRNGKFRSVIKKIKDDKKRL